MNAPLLVSLLPPEWPAGSEAAVSASAPFVAILLLAGLLLSLVLRHPGR